MQMTARLMYGSMLISYAYAFARRSGAMVMSNPQPAQLATPHPGIRPPWQLRAMPPVASSLLVARRFSSDPSMCEQQADCGSNRRSHGGATTDAIHPVVEISPPDLVSRRAITWHGVT